ncbi:MAG: SpoIID/LytB domain-containing protein [Halanaerobacter sp.]
MWAKLNKKRQLLLAVIIFLVIMIGSAAVGVIFNYPSQPQAEEINKEELLRDAKNKYYQGQYQESIELYQEILQQIDSTSARANLAAIYEELGDYDLALQQYQKLVEETERADYKLSLAQAYYNRDRLEEAQQELKKIIESDIDDDYLLKETYYYLSLLDRQSGDLSGAKKDLKEALDYREWALGYFHLGEIAYEEENYEQAIDYYKAASSTDGSLKEVNKKLALAYLKLGRKEEGAKYIQRAKREDKTDRVVTEKAAQLEKEFPEYFKHDPITPPKREDIPEQVEFREIKSLPNPGQELRIGIMTDQPRIFARVGSNFEVLEDGAVIAQGEKGELISALLEGEPRLKIGEEEFDLSKPVTIRPTSYAPILVHQVEYGAGYYWGGRVDMQYRGQLELRVVEDSLRAINIVSLEEYLMSVVPSEMIASWPLEALKVQSVAARSYTLANLDKHKQESYDLCSTVHCAAYRGIKSEHERSNQAVKETAGEIMTYDGQPINAVYSANSGGHTENSEDVWNFAVPYLKGVSTGDGAAEFPLPPAELKDWLQRAPSSHSQDSEYTKQSHYRWQRELDVDYLEERLDLAEIKSIIPTNRGVGGSVESVLVKGANEEKKIKSGLRYKFGGLRSNRFWIQPQYRNGELASFIFYGGGWGHNVGMDQVAVASMADSDYGYRDILKHFYTGVKIGQKQ